MTLRRKRWVLFLGSLAFLTASLLLPGELGKLAVLLLGAAALLVFLYRNMGELTGVEEGNLKLGLLQQTVLFTFGFLALAVGAVWLVATGRVSERQEELLAAGLYTDLDGDTLGRYLVAQRQYLLAAEETDTALTDKDLDKADAWGKVMERHFKQARACANDMGLTVTSRCRLVVPEGKQAGEEDNPFLQLIQGGQKRA